MVEWTMDFSVKTHVFGPVPKTNIILDSRVIIGVSTESAELGEMNRGSKQIGTEVGYVNLRDSDSIPNYANDSISPNVTNLFDSDGTMVKVIRFIERTE